jgi:hypothetical protein
MELTGVKLAIRPFWQIADGLLDGGVGLFLVGAMGSRGKLVVKP